MIERDSVIIKLIIISFLLVGCSTKSNSLGVGYWKETYPHNVSEWQCIESIKPHRNKEC